MSAVTRDFTLDSTFDDESILDQFDFELEMFTKEWWLITLAQLFYVSIPLAILLKLNLITIALIFALFNLHEVVGYDDDYDDDIAFLNDFYFMENDNPSFSTLNIDVKGMGDGEFSADAFKYELSFLKNDNVFEPFSLVFKSLSNLKDAAEEKSDLYPISLIDRFETFSRDINILSYNLLSKLQNISSKKITLHKNPNFLKLFYYDIFLDKYFNKLEIFSNIITRKNSLFDNIKGNFKKKNARDFYIPGSKYDSNIASKHLSEDAWDAVALKSLIIYNLKSIGYYNNNDFDYYYFKRDLKKTCFLSKKIYNNLYSFNLKKNIKNKKNI